MKFILHHQRSRAFQDVLVNMFNRRDAANEEFWALRGVSFDVMKGETLGIVGQNGSGKSTILKLITRILDPTSGTITVTGRVSALIELGAGFHPDLTGRENIYLYGSILGYSGSEMDRKFNSIVSFAELERFIDTPVKHYSSGMYMRLGFSVAISVDPDVLIIDEVLAVGDEAFQRKCFDRIAELRGLGKTIMFVSHSAEAVTKLCDRVVWLENGVIRDAGPPARTLLSYSSAMRLRADTNRTETTAPVEPSPSANSPELPDVLPGIEITEIRTFDENGVRKNRFRTGERLVFRLKYRIIDPTAPSSIRFSIKRADGLLVHQSAPRKLTVASETVETGMEVGVTFPSIALLPGNYSIVPHSGDPGPGVKLDQDVENGCSFSVWNTDENLGVVSLVYQWHVENVESEPSANLVVTH